MSVTPSTMLSLGTEAPYFKLPDIDSNLVSLDDFKDAKALLVVFMCNHCPYVKHIVKDFVKLAEGYGAIGMRITKTKDIESTIRKSLKVNDKPVVMDFIIEREEKVMPMVPAGASLTDMIEESE